MEFTAEFGTLTSRGVFRVANRSFLDRRLTRAEKRALQGEALYSVPDGTDVNTAFLCHMLNTLRLKSSEADVTPEWIDSSLTDEEVTLTITYILHGPEGVVAALSSARQTST